jgi:hypothetical protein
MAFISGRNLASQVMAWSTCFVDLVTSTYFTGLKCSASLDRSHLRTMAYQVQKHGARYVIVLEVCSHSHHLSMWPFRSMSFSSKNCRWLFFSVIHCARCMHTQTLYRPMRCTSITAHTLRCCNARFWT